MSSVKENLKVEEKKEQACEENKQEPARIRLEDLNFESFDSRDV